MHLFRSAQKSHYYLVSSKKSKYDGDYSFVPFFVCDLLKNCSITLLSDPYYRFIDKGYLHVVGSCNGLACLLNYDDHDEHTASVYGTPPLEQYNFFLGIFLMTCIN